MRRFAQTTLLSVMLASAAVPVAAAATGRIEGTYAMHAPGKTAPTDFDGTAADASWTVGTTLAAKNAQGELPATLIRATHGPLVQQCAEDPAYGTITTSMSGVADPAAIFRFYVQLDLLHGRGLVTAYVDPSEFGMSRLLTQTRCDPDYGGTSDDEQDYPVSAAFSTVSGPNDWKVRRAGANRWTASGTQQLKPAPGSGDAGPSTATLSLTMTGSPTALQAGCRLPTPRDLRAAHTRTAALRILHRAGLRADPSRTTLAVRYLPKGRFFVNDWAVDHYDSCGSAVQLVRNAGSTPGGGHGGA